MSWVRVCVCVLCVCVCMCSVHLAASVKVGIETVPFMSVPHLHVRISCYQWCQHGGHVNAYTHTRACVVYTVRYLVVMQYQMGRRHLFYLFYQAGDCRRSDKAVQFRLLTPAGQVIPTSRMV
jgi:hypothetical protein